MYREVWAIPAVRHSIILGTLGKMPWFGAAIILTLHVVQTLGRPYSAAGLLTAVFTLAVAVASPWRGRLLDTVGLRRTLLPSLVVLPIAFVAAPFMGFWTLLASMGLVGLLAVPWFVLTRQMVIAAVPVRQRRTAVALDSVATEIGFMVGPTLGVLAAVYGDTRWALPLFGLTSIAAAGLLAWVNPPLVDPKSTPQPESERGWGWLNANVAALFLATIAVTFTLSGTDLGMVAATRTMGAESFLAVAIVAWGFGSLLGALFYGSLRMSRIPVMTLTLGLAITTIPVALARDPWSLAVLLFVTGLFCAPSLSAIIEALSHAVPESRRGEAMGWQGAFSTVGNASAPPIIGFILDEFGWQQGFIWTGVGGVVAAVAGWALITAGRRLRRSRRLPDAPGVRSAQEEPPQPEGDDGDPDHRHHHEVAEVHQGQ